MTSYSMMDAGVFFYGRTIPCHVAKGCTIPCHVAKGRTIPCHVAKSVNVVPTDEPMPNDGYRSATSMRGMFYKAKQFNQDISSWPVCP